MACGMAVQPLNVANKRKVFAKYNVGWLCLDQVKIWNVHYKIPKYMWFGCVCLDK